MSEPSRELLDMPSKPSIFDFLLLGHNEQEGKPKGNPSQQLTTTVPRSEVLGKVSNFLGKIAKANEQLAIDVQEKPREEIDLEACTGNEKEYIQIDLLLGVADLNSDEAVAAAETAMHGIQSTTRPVCCSSSEEEEEDESDASDKEGEASMVGCDENVRKKEDRKPHKKRQNIEELN